MKLTELFDSEYGSAVPILRILIRQADAHGGTVTLPFNSVKQLFDRFDLPLGDGGPISADIIRKLQDIPGAGKIIKAVDDKTGAITLKTTAENPDVPEPGKVPATRTSVDQMASHNARLSLKK